ncbi:MAG: VacJ family lipoprotein [Candidatus Binataceae bacterium]|nr:VacJ family lipoprotein [Candidatus Binataceae bacterium]
MRSGAHAWLPIAVPLAILASLLMTGLLCVSPAMAGESGAVSVPPQDSGPPAGPNNDQPYSDPLEPFNNSMLNFNLHLDHYVVFPIAKAYASAVPQPARESVGNFLNNVGVVPRFANNLFQLHFTRAGTEVARFGINSTLGVAGLFDVADKWFGLKEHPDDFGLTLGHYGVPTGPYLVLPFFGPSSIRDTAGLFADGAMNPLDYFVPWYIYIPTNATQDAVSAINYRSLHLNLFADVDRYAIDMYGAVQDGYLQRRANQLKKVDEGTLFGE